MFKLCMIALVAIAAAADTEAPVISIDQAYTLPAGHAWSSSNPNQYVDDCEVGAATCQLPTATAYDHHDGAIAASEISQTTTRYIKSDPGTTPALDTAETTYSEDNWKAEITALRGIFNIAFDVKDAAQNQADTLTYSLFMLDSEKPTCAHTAWTQNIEFGASSFAEETIHCDDNYDLTNVNVYVDGTLHSNNGVLTHDHRHSANNCDRSHTETIRVEDWAGIFGENYQNNKLTHTVSYTARDRTAPALNNVDYAMVNNEIFPSLVGNGNNKFECSKTFTGATSLPNANQCTDTGDACQGVALTLTATATKTHWDRPGAFTVDVTCTDHASALNSGDSDNSTPKSGAFTIEDKTPPSISLNTVTLADSDKMTRVAGTGSNIENTKGGSLYDADNGAATNTAYVGANVIQHSAGYAADATQLAALTDAAHSTCTDTCYNANLVTTTEWHSSTGECASLASGSDTAFDIVQVGTFVLKYTCTDDASNEAYACRTVYNVDHTKPVLNLQILQEDVDRCQAAGINGNTCVDTAAGTNYVDSGAVCTDLVDGPISDEVEVSGDVVDLSVAATYRITYKCVDTAGNAADPMTRTVYVVDRECPTCSTEGASHVTVEASFPYTDLGATCTDNAGDVTTETETDNTHANSGLVNVEKVGTYKLTYTATDVSGNTNTATGICVQGQTTAPVRTVIVEDSLKPIITLSDSTLMEESTSSVNGWVVGAIASAVSGVALVGYAATRKNAVATSVPV